MKKAGLLDENGNPKKGLDIFNTGEKRPYIWQEGGWEAWKKSWGF